LDTKLNSVFIKPGDITINDGFWSPIMERVRTKVIPYQWETLNDRVPGADPSFSMRNFRLAAELTHPELDYGVPKDAGFGGCIFQDSDTAKWIEAAAYSLVRSPDPALEATLDGAIEIICNAQQPDGYLNTYYIITGLDKRWTNLKDNHELYCMGHFIEAAVAYYEVTGKRKLLDGMIRYVDCVDRYIGAEAGKLHGYPGHEIAELALVRLYGVTKNERHLALAKYFIDERGKAPLFFEEETKRNGNDFYWKNSYVQYQYYQAGRPVREQRIAEGHAVRAVYLYAGMADVARLTGDSKLFETCEALFANIAKKQMYITGGIGQSAYGEAFSYNYDLPNDTVYAETCASIGLAFFARRMAETAPSSAYADVIEKTLFNGILSGMSLDGKSFFYVNPLEVLPEASLKDRRMGHVKIERQKWFPCACCPPNLARIIASLGNYVHSVNDDSIFTHLYIGSEAKITVGGKSVALKIETNYPWEGRVNIGFTVDGSGGTDGGVSFVYGFRIPAWNTKREITLNGEKAGITIKDGYAYINREWHTGDNVSIEFDMPVSIVEANPHVRVDTNKVAIMRGPVVYCLEEKDNGAELHKLRLENPPPREWAVEYDKNILEGVTVISCRGKREKDWPGDELYRAVEAPEYEDQTLRFIPYYAWANRGAGEMTVWVNKS
jgi:DUF1680 family protein